MVCSFPTSCLPGRVYNVLSRSDWHTYLDVVIVSEKIRYA